MGYTVQELARLAGISPRTIRYYDEIGLLKPARFSTSGYRLYGQAEVDRLQQILFYRELGVELKAIKRRICTGNGEISRGTITTRRPMPASSACTWKIPVLPPTTTTRCSRGRAVFTRCGLDLYRAEPMR